VVTTTTQLADFARVVGGARVKVYGVLKANVDPHDYEATPADIEAIAKADVVVKNGVGLEKWFEPAIHAAAPKGKVVDASAGVAVRKDDPHIWHDPRNAKVMVRNITDALATADAGAAGAFRSTEARYDKELDALDAENAARIATLTDKKLVTNHDALHYYVDRYGLDLVGEVIPSFDTQAELSAADVASLVAKIKAQHVKAIFSESSLPPKTAAAIASEAGVKVVQGDDALFGDSMGRPGSNGDTYLKMERHNTKVIVDNLH
jgi:ABC-type Zn uptake system ZnuABC Zn-binding protein ZnuA